MTGKTGNLFEARTLARRTDPATSKQAAKKIVKIGKQFEWMKQIMEILSLRPDFADGVVGFTMKEAAAEYAGGQWVGAYYNYQRVINKLHISGQVIIVAERESKVGGGICRAFRISTTKEL